MDQERVASVSSSHRIIIENDVNEHVQNLKEECQVESQSFQKSLSDSSFSAMAQTPQQIGGNKVKVDGLKEGVLQNDSSTTARSTLSSSENTCVYRYPTLSPYLCIIGPPTFIIVFVIGIVKASLVVIPTMVVIMVGNTGTTIHLFPSTTFLTYKAIRNTKYLRLSQKAVAMLLVAIPLIIGPVLILAGSTCGSFLFGFFAPLLATFEALRKENSEHRVYHVLQDGIVDTLETASKVALDFADFFRLSLPAYLEDFENRPKDREQNKRVRLLLLPGCLLISIFGAAVDAVLISLISIIKSLTLLYRGWQQLICTAVVVSLEEDVEESMQMSKSVGSSSQGGGRGRTSLSACDDSPLLCLPVAFLAMVAWPAVVVFVVLLAVLSSPFVGMYAGVVAFQEGSLIAGVLYSLAIAAEFDEYINELLEIGSYSCIPKPEYRGPHIRSFKHRTGEAGTFRQKFGGTWIPFLSRREANKSNAAVPLSSTSSTSSLARSLGGSQRRTVLQSLSDVKTVGGRLEETRIYQVWDSIFRQSQLQGLEACEQGVITEPDLNDWLAAKKTVGSAVVGPGLVGLCLLRSLEKSYKEGSRGLLLADGLEILPYDRPSDRVFDWFFEPLLELKEQLEISQLSEDEERYVEAWLVSMGDESKFAQWLSIANMPVENKRKMELQSFGRRLQGMATSITRFPTFRRKYQRVVKLLLQFTKDNGKNIIIKSSSEPGLSTATLRDVV